MMHQMDESFIILDALDECRTRKGTETESLLSWIKSILSIPRITHLLITSRPEEDIESALSKWMTDEDKIHLSSERVNQDIYPYIRSKITEDDGLRRWRTQPNVQKEIETKLSEIANGM